MWPPGNRTTVSSEDHQTIHAQPLLRHLISQIQSKLFSQPPLLLLLLLLLPPPQRAAATPTSAASSCTRGTSASCRTSKAGSTSQLASGATSTVPRRAAEVFHGVEVLHAIKLYLVRGVEEHEALKKRDSRVLKLDRVEEEEEGGAVVFEVKGYTEDSVELVQREARNQSRPLRPGRFYLGKRLLGLNLSNS